MYEPGVGPTEPPHHLGQPHEKSCPSTASTSYQIDPSSLPASSAGACAEGASSAAAGAEGAASLQQEPPRNPGSRMHPATCKPCNKFNPDRPDSCKHGDLCDFCHYPHDRPKHRGQRGRHAQQRRQYLETRDSLSEEMKNLTDRVYEVPHEAFEEVKKRLQTVPRECRHQKVLDVLEQVRHIGEQAQECRADKHRVRGARTVTPEGAGPVLELEGRCKWLVGTLHLMVRKMHDAQKDHSVIGEKVNEVLEQCRQLPDMVTAVEPPLPALPPGAEKYVTEEQWYVEDPFDLKHNLAGRSSRVACERILSNIKDTCAARCRGHGDGVGATSGMPSHVEQRQPAVQKRRCGVPSKMVAILVAMQTYVDCNITNLQCAQGDVSRIAEVLQKEGWEVRKAVDLSEADVRTYFSGCFPREEAPPKEVLVYWSGHSEQWGASNRLFCKDSIPDRRHDATPTLNYILRQLVKSTSESTRILFILDGCRDIARAMPPMMPDSAPLRGQCWVMYACGAGDQAVEGFEDENCSDFNVEFRDWLIWQFQGGRTLDISSYSFAGLRDAVSRRTHEFQRPEMLQLATQPWNAEASDSSYDGESRDQ